MFPLHSIRMNSDFLVGKLLEQANPAGALKMKAFVVGDFCTTIYGGVGEEKSNLCRYYKPRKHGMFEKNIRCLTADKSKQHLNVNYLAWSNTAQMARYDRKLVMNIVMTVNKHSSQQGA